MRPVVSIFMILFFVGLSASGVLLFLTKEDPFIIFLHVVFGTLFLLSAFFHFYNNLRSIITYLQVKMGKIAMLMATLIVLVAWFEIEPFAFLKESYARFKATQPLELENGAHVIYQTTENPNLTFEVRAGAHFWFPQITLWTEDTTGRFIQTLLVTHSTAKGEFIGGRTKDNFKTFDTEKGKEMAYEQLRRVDALPHWSHARGVRASDGLFAPMASDPLPDGISGATPSGSFQLQTQHFETTKFKVLLEVNVAFDDNKYYSEYDFPDNTAYHSGTGLLGQPSIVYEAVIDPAKPQKYYLMKYKGHTSPSGPGGQLYADQYGLTTALQIIDLALIKCQIK